LTLQSLGEFFHVTVRKGILKPSDAISWVGDFRSLFVIEAADVEVLGRAMALTSSHRISFWDALIFATVRQAGCGLLLSEDLQDRQRIDGIQIINPFTGPLPAVLEGLLDSRSDQADDSRA
jgi:predicted nucleic acid-binding protein